MALTGELSDLSLAELLEFFCNQRKTGRLKVTYAIGEGYFYLKSGSVIHAHFGDLRGIDAVYYALTQSNASFTFSSAVEAPEHSINQPWTSVVLEGLRRMDEGVTPPQPSAASLVESSKAVSPASADTSSVTSAAPEKVTSSSTDDSMDVKAFGVLLSSSDNSFTPRRWHPALVVAAVVLLFAAVGVPWAWYTRQKAARITNPPNTATVTPTPIEAQVTEGAQTEITPESQPAAEVDASELARRQREARLRERARLEQGAANAGANSDPAKPAGPPTAPPPVATSNKRATVQVTYDENGRVTAASGGDATALRIARQKRFPPGKAGSATITIPIN